MTMDLTFFYKKVGNFASNTGTLEMFQNRVVKEIQEGFIVYTMHKVSLDFHRKNWIILTHFMPSPKEGPFRSRVEYFALPERRVQLEAVSGPLR